MVAIFDNWWGHRTQGLPQGLIGSNLVSFHLVVLKKNFDFKTFQLSTSMVVILDVGKGHQTQFWKRTIQRRLQCKNLTDDRRQMPSQSSRNVSVLSDMTSKIWADFSKD